MGFPFFLFSARQTLPPPPHGLLFDTQRDADDGNGGCGKRVELAYPLSHYS